MRSMVTKGLLVACLAVLVSTIACTEGVSSDWDLLFGGGEGSHGRSMRPTVTLGAHPTQGPAPLTVVFTFQAASNSGGVIEKMTFDPGDGGAITVQNGGSYTVVYDNDVWWLDRDVTAKLTAVDDGEFWASTTVTITVEPNPDAPVWQDPFGPGFWGN